MATVGPGAVQQDIEAPKPSLDGASEYEYITILNPLSDDFAVRVAQDIPVNMPTEIRAKTGLIQNENDVVRSYGIDLKNPDFKGRKHIINDTIIKAGQTINLKGNEAQVAVRQLTNEILQREGNKRLMSDPHLRKAVEDRIIQGRGSIQELMDGNLRSARTQIDEAITKSNEAQDEPEFPGLNNQPTQQDEPGSEQVGADDPAPKRRAVGRPKKA